MDIWQFKLRNSEIEEKIQFIKKRYRVEKIRSDGHLAVQVEKFRN